MSLKSERRVASSGQTESAYPRENWWGDNSTHDSTGADVEKVDGKKNNSNHEFDPNDPARIIAFDLLRGSGTPLCAATLFDEPWNGGRIAELFSWCFDDECIDGRSNAMHHDNYEAELSEPQVRLGIKRKGECCFEEYGAERYRKRVNETTGYLSGGETTSIVWQDRAVEKFMEVVEIYLSSRPNVLEREKDKVRGLAHHLKSKGEMKDLDIMTRVVDELRTGGSE